MTSKNLLRHFCEKKTLCVRISNLEKKSFLAQGFAIESSGEAKLEEGVGGGGGLFDFLLVLPSWNLLSHLADAFSSSST